MGWDRVVRWVRGAGHVVLFVIWAAVLLDGLPATDGPGTRLGRILVVGLGACVLTARLVVPWADGRRRDPVVGTAPSGVPALCFVRSPVVAVVVGLVLAFLVGWLAAFAVLAFGHGRAGWAALSLALLLVLARQLAVLVARRGGLGGLWLTRAGVEYRRHTTRWTVPWTELDRVLRPSDPERDPVGSGTRPVFLVLRAGARVERPRHRGGRYRLPDDVLVVDTSGLAGGRRLVVDTVDRHLRHPGLRGNLGTAAAVPRCPV